MSWAESLRRHHQSAQALKWNKLITIRMSLRVHSEFISLQLLLIMFCNPFARSGPIVPTVRSENAIQIGRYTFDSFHEYHSIRDDPV